MVVNEDESVTAKMACVILGHPAQDHLDNNSYMNLIVLPDATYITAKCPRCGGRYRVTYHREGWVFHG